MKYIKLVEKDLQDIYDSSTGISYDTGSKNEYYNSPVDFNCTSGNFKTLIEYMLTTDLPVDTEAEGATIDTITYAQINSLMSDNDITGNIKQFLIDEVGLEESEASKYDYTFAEIVKDFTHYGILLLPKTFEDCNIQIKNDLGDINCEYLGITTDSFYLYKMSSEFNAFSSLAQVSFIIKSKN